MFKFLHAADIHLDSPLRGLGRSDDIPADEVRGATRRALDNLVRLAIDERVAFVLIAGDVYDGDWKDHNTGLWFVRQMAKLRDARIPVFLIRGNHDAQNKMTALLPLPDNVRSLSTDRAESRRLDSHDVIVHGQGFATERVVEDLASSYPPADRGALNIGLLHTSATGGVGEHARYAPCTVDALRSKGYDYWALGHIHKRELLFENDPWIAFAGNVQGRHIRESGPKGCLLVTVDDHRTITGVEFKPLDVLRWGTIRVDATGVVDRDEVLQRFEDASPSFIPGGDDHPLIARVELSGRCLAHDKLAANLPLLASEIRAKAMGLGGGRLWVEKVKLSTRPLDAGPYRTEDDSIGVLLATLADLDRDPTALVALAGSELGDLRKRLAAEVAGFDSVNFDSIDWLKGALDEARSLLVTRLQS
jgi:exonuclease SbcD